MFDIMIINHLITINNFKSLEAPGIRTGPGFRGFYWPL